MTVDEKKFPSRDFPDMLCELKNGNNRKKRHVKMLETCPSGSVCCCCYWSSWKNLGEVALPAAMFSKFPIFIISFAEFRMGIIQNFFAAISDGA